MSYQSEHGIYYDGINHDEHSIRFDILQHPPYPYQFAAALAATTLAGLLHDLRHFLSLLISYNNLVTGFFSVDIRIESNRIESNQIECRYWYTG